MDAVYVLQYNIFNAIINTTRSTTPTVKTCVYYIRLANAFVGLAECVWGTAATI